MTDVFTVIPAGYTPEDWAVAGPLIMERLRAELVERDLLTPDSAELPDADINPDEAEPLPPEEPVKTDPVPEEPQ